jgi:hypothetical protein
MAERNPFDGWNKDLPARVECRGEFPAHYEGPEGHLLLTAAQAKRRARQRLEEWRRDHGIRDEL